jgi:class 3 adenylate cyclase
MRALLSAMAEDWEWFTNAWLRGLAGWDNPRGGELAARVRERWSPQQLRDLIEGCAKLDVTQDLASVRAPTLVLHVLGSYYPDSYSQQIASRIPDCEMTVVRDFWVTLEDAIRTFLADVGTGPAEPAEPAAGFQTILFTDLEASTELTQRLGDEQAQQLLRGHDASVRAALEGNAGREVKHTGDGIMASFPSAVSAVSAALQIQRDLAGGEVRVRIGLNAGEPIAERDDLFGLAVIKAARIADRADPGQVLVADVVRQLCEGKQFAFSPLSSVPLKGFDEPVPLFAASHRAGLDTPEA